MANPTGGVRKAVCKQTANMTVNQMRSNPNPVTTGATNGNTMSVISIQSKTKPNKKVTKRMVMMMPEGSKGNPSSPRSINSSPPSPLRTREKAVAPKKIAKIYAVVRVVSVRASLTTSRDNLPAIQVNTTAPNAPTPAASVGVARPKKMDPSTAKIRRIGGNTDFANAPRRSRVIG